MGFVGSESFHFAYAGVCLALNTFGFDHMAAVAVHIVALRWEQKYGSGRDGKAIGGGRIFRTLVGASLLYRMAMVLCGCASAALLRRHLMVWAVFAPKAAFEAAFWVVGGGVHVLLDLFCQV